MDLISTNSRDASSEASSTVRIAAILESYQPAADVTCPNPCIGSTQEQQQEEERVEAVASVKHSVGGMGSSSNSTGTCSGYPSSWPTQFSVLTRRAYWQVTRDRLPLVIAYVQVGRTALIHCSTSRAGVASAIVAVLNEKNPCLFFFLLIVLFTSVFHPNWPPVRPALPPVSLHDGSAVHPLLQRGGLQPAAGAEPAGRPLLCGRLPRIQRHLPGG